MALSEPALSETAGLTYTVAIHHSLDEAVRRGAPARAAQDSPFAYIDAELCGEARMVVEQARKWSDQ